MMKFIYTFSFLLLLGGTTTLMAQGPDEYGYTWKDSNDPEGPTFEWIDISGFGNEITDLGDDNSSATLLDLGMDFAYYWGTYNALRVGSNGWLSFNSNTNNISSCFDVIPFPGGGGNNLLCPLMSDINFEGGGNPAKLYYYHDEANNKYIVTYANVPFWVQGGTSFSGDNTFQVILDANDSSITFQYQNMDDVYANPSCPIHGIIGMENLTGTIGLSVLTNTMPPDNYAIKFIYPDVVTFEIFDLSPDWGLNDQNGAEFILPDPPFQFSTSISNTGNTDVSSETDVDLIIWDNNLPVHGDEATMAALAQASSTIVDFGMDISLDPGQYRAEVSLTNSDDLNPLNDENSTEINIVDLSTDVVTLNYAKSETNTGVLSWASGGSSGSGVGIYIIPPFYPCVIESVEMFVVSVDPTSDAYTVQINGEDANGNPDPAALLALEALDAGSYASGTWVETQLTTPVTINSGGFYVSWNMLGDNVQIGTITSPNEPISFRTFEILSGQWAAYRDRSTTDFMIRVNVDNPFVVSTNDVAFDQSIRVFPNPVAAKTTVSYNLESATDLTMKLVNTVGKSVITEQLRNVQAGSTELNVSDLPQGIYWLQISDGLKQTVRKVSVIR